LDHHEIEDLVDDEVDLTGRGLRVRDLATTEADRELDLVAALDEATYVLHLEPDVVVVGLRAQLDLLELDLRLTFPGFVLLLLFVLEAPEVHDLARGRDSLRIHLDEVEVLLAGEPPGFVRVEDAEHLAGVIDDADLRDTNPVVDARSEIALTVARIEAGSSQ